MKRTFVLMASLCALFMALAAAPAFAGGAQPIGGLLQPSGGDQNGQSNTTILSNDPVLSGNSVALVNEGNQQSSANTDATQVNSGSNVGQEGGSYGDGQPAATVQPTNPSPMGPSGGGSKDDGGQSNTAILSNDPVASGNSVAVVNGGRSCGCDGSEGGNQTSSADATLTQVNSSQGGSQPDNKWDKGSKGDDGQSNTAVLSNDPVLSGNSVAVVNTGDQSSSADTTLKQVNKSSSEGQSGPSGKSCGCEGGKDGNNGKNGGKDGGDQSNTAILSNDPVLSGNSVALVNTGDQHSSADTTLTQINKQGGDSKPSGKWDKGSKGNDGQSNTAVLSNDPVLSGNSVALVNTGDQSSSADAKLTQVNHSSSDKGPKSKPESKPCPKPEPKPCPKPEPKPCPKPEPKPCPKPEPKPCLKPEPKPCQPKPCEPKPCEPKPCEPKPCEPKPCPPKPCEPKPCDVGLPVLGTVVHLI